MSKKLVDHTWAKIIERDSQAKEALLTKIGEIVELVQRSRGIDGKEASRLISDDGRLEYALRKCLDHLEGSSSVNENDYFIFYEYATGAAKRAEEMMLE